MMPGDVKRLKQRKSVPINLVFTTVNVSAALVILISAIGAVIVYFIGAVSRFKLKKT